MSAAKRKWFTLVDGKLPPKCPMCGLTLAAALSKAFHPYTTTYQPCGCEEDEDSP